MKSDSDIKELLAKSLNPGNIPAKLMAYYFYLKELKRIKKHRKNFFAFATTSDELDQLAELIEKMIIYADKDLRFQLAVSKWDGSEFLNHWSFLEFQFKAGTTDTPSALDILICDPLGFNQSLVLANFISSKLELGYLSKLCTLKVFIPTDTLQIKGRVCAYFVTDNISMLSNQDDYCSVYDYMTTHPQEEKKREAVTILNKFRDAFAGCYLEDELDAIYNFEVVIGAFPVRLLRSKHSVPDLEKEVRDSEDLRDVIVNRKGESAWASINKNLFFVLDREGLQEKRNFRVNKKMEKLEESAKEASSSLSSLEDAEVIREGIQRHLLSGLEEMILQSIQAAGATYTH